MKNNSATQETRRRLLAAAGEVFADRGFHAATIKEITDRAEASLASVNYHFQDKAELYAAVLRRIAEDAAELIPPDNLLRGDPATRFRQFVRYLCLRLMGLEKPVWEHVLMAREMAEPTPALQPLLEKVLNPLNQKLSALIADLLGTAATDKSVGYAAASVMGQSVHFIRYRRMFGKVHPQLGNRPDAEEVAAHIAAFSLAGIRAQRKQLNRAHDVASR